MSIYLLLHSLDTQQFWIQLHLFPVLCLSISIASLFASRFAALNGFLLNLTSTKLGSLDIRGNSLVVTFMVWRASGGRKDRNNRAVLALGEKGLKTVETSVRNRVIILKESFLAMLACIHL